MTSNPSSPATQADLFVLKQELIAAMTEISSKDNAITREHFDVVAENIHADLAGANRDEISVLQDTKHNHETRIAQLEQVAGLRA